MEITPSEIDLTITAAKTASSWELYLPAVFGLVGAFIGALAGVLGTYLTLRSTRTNQENQRLYEARKSAYSKAIAIFSYVTVERTRTGTIIDAETAAKVVLGEDIHKIMGELNLFSTTDLNTKIRAIFRKFDVAPATNPQLRIAEWDELKLQWQVVLDQMREELGTGAHLTTNI